MKTFRRFMMLHLMFRFENSENKKICERFLAKPRTRTETFQIPQKHFRSHLFTRTIMLYVCTLNAKLRVLKNDKISR